MKSIAGSHPQLVSKFGSIGKSVEGRSIPVMHLRSNITNPDRATIWYPDSMQPA